jgi:hypothetical protein
MRIVRGKSNGEDGREEEEEGGGQHERLEGENKSLGLSHAVTVA